MNWTKVGSSWLGASCAAIIGVGLLGSACSGSDAGSGSTPGTGGSRSVGSGGAAAVSVTDLDGILTGEAQRYCDRLFRCAEGDDDFIAARLILKDRAGCEAILADLNAKSALVSDLRSQLQQGAVQIVPEKAQACLDEIGSCNGPDSFSRGSCRDMFEGRVALGSPCQRSEDCAGDAFCQVTAQCPGTCSARKASGQACQSDQECTAGDGYTFCEYAASGATCRTLPVSSKAALGQPCTRRTTGAETLELCADGLWCGSVAGQAETATLGTCQAPIPNGGACADEDDMCAEGLCDTSIGVCRSVTLLEHAGDDCDKNGFRWCNPRLGLLCNAQGVCEATGDHTQGSVCSDADFQLTCNSGLYCHSAQTDQGATCQPLLENGASCEEASSCKSGACDQTCQERPCVR